jgi:hypothetical protein
MEPPEGNGGSGMFGRIDRWPLAKKRPVAFALPGTLALGPGCNDHVSNKALSSGNDDWISP